MLKEGVLEKKSNAFHGMWQSRTFRLYKGSILYSERQHWRTTKYFEPNKWCPKEKQCIMLDAISDVSVRYDSKASFDIVTRTRTYHLRADSDATARGWIDAIQGACNTKHLRQSPLLKLHAVEMGAGSTCERRRGEAPPKEARLGEDANTAAEEKPVAQKALAEATVVAEALATPVAVAEAKAAEEASVARVQAFYSAFAW